MLAHKRYHSDLKAFTCELCDKTFKQKGALDTHQKRHIKDYKVFCEAGFYSNCEYKLHVGSKHGQSEFVYLVCDKSYYNKNGRALHMPLHEEGYRDTKRYNCDLCGKGFLQQSYLRDHMGRTHDNSARKQYICDRCGKKVCSGTSLKEHQLLLHEGLKSDKCEFCEKCFSSKSNLSVHLRTLTGERPYQCEHCEKSFTQRNTFVIHLRHHTGELPYACRFRGETFISRNTLNLHQKNKHNVLKIDSFK